MRQAKGGNSHPGMFIHIWAKDPGFFGKNTKKVLVHGVLADRMNGSTGVVRWKRELGRHNSNISLKAKTPIDDEFPPPDGF
jgi:hypothetical protein